MHLCECLCLMERSGAVGGGGFGGRAGTKRTRSTLTGRTQSCSHCHACKPDYPKIGQWNTTHRERDAHAHTWVHTCIYTCMQRYQLEESKLCQCRVALSATRVQRCHTHLPTEQTRPLDWNNRIKIRTERERDGTPSPPYHPP